MMPHRGQPDWEEIGRRAERLRRDVDLIGYVSFKDVSGCLGDLVRQEIDATSYSEIFVARLPLSPALARGTAEQRRRTQLLIRAHQFFVRMEPHEEAILWILGAGEK